MPFGRSDGISWRLRNEKLITRDEVTKILGLSKKRDEFDYALFATLANSGFRISEVLHLDVKSVEGDQLIVVRRKKAELTREPVDVAEGLLALLSKRAKELKKGWLWPGDSGPCHRDHQKKGVVTGTEQLCGGGHISKREVQRRFETYCRDAKCWRDGRGVHSLRHYAGTEFYKETRDLRATQVLLGHSSSVITETYAHVVDMKDKIRAVKPVL